MVLLAIRSFKFPLKVFPAAIIYSWICAPIMVPKLPLWNSPQIFPQASIPRTSQWHWTPLAPCYRNAIYPLFSDIFLSFVLVHHSFPWPICFPHWPPFSLPPGSQSTCLCFSCCRKDYYNNDSNSKLYVIFCKIHVVPLNGGDGISQSVSSVAQSCPTLCDPMNRSTPGLSVHHQLPEFTQTHVHQVGDTIQPSHPLLSPSPPAPNPSQNQSLFSDESTLRMRWPKYWSFSFSVFPSKEIPGLISLMG